MIGDLLSGRVALSLVVGIRVVKSLIWGLSLGSGTSGWVLAPTYMIGAALGALTGFVLPAVGPGFRAVVGLAATVGGVMRSPLPAWCSPRAHPRLARAPPDADRVGVAYGMSVLLLRRSVLTEKIARRGRHLSREYGVDPLEPRFVDEAMPTSPVVLDPGAEGPDDAPGRQRLFPVVDGGRLVGVVLRTSRALVDDPVVVGPDDTLVVARNRLLAPG